MSLSTLRRAAVAGIVFAGLFLVPATPAAAAPIGPKVIAVHRNGAVDITGSSTYGTIAKMKVPAGNWLITATATIQSTQSVLAVFCQLVAGSDSYTSRADPNAQGPGSLAAMELLLAHHFATSGSVVLKCQDTDWTGDVLIRDVHVTAVQVAQLTDSAGVFGSGTPTAIYGQDGSQRLYFDTAVHDVQQVALPTGTWLVQAAGWGFGEYDGDEVDCSLQSGSSTVDSMSEDFNKTDAGRNIGLEGLVTVSGRAAAVIVNCHDTAANWSIRGSAISALKVGTLTYGRFGLRLTTSGSGSPVVDGIYSDAVGNVAQNQNLQSIGYVTPAAGSWFVTSHVSLISSAFEANVTCQVQFGGADDQGRVLMDNADYRLDWLSSSLTKKVSTATKAAIACNHSANGYQVQYDHYKVFAIEAGTLTDTDID